MEGRFDGVGLLIARVIMFALVLTHALLSLRAVPFSGPRNLAAVLWQQLATWCQAARRFVTCHYETGDAEENDMARAKANLAADAVQQRKAAVRRASTTIFVHTVSMLAVAHAGINIWGNYTPPVGTTIAGNTGLLLSILHVHCPGRRSWQSSRVLIGAAVIGLQIASGVNMQDLVSATIVRFAVANPFRTAASIATLDTPYVFVMNGASTVVFGIRILLSTSEVGFAYSRMLVCLGDVFATLFIVASSRFYEDNVITSCWHAIELKASKIDAHATSKVLHKMCDAVVHVDEHLHVAAADASLAALLLHGRGRGYIETGVDLLQYLHKDSDRGPLRDWLKVSDNPCQDHVTFETTLRDSAGSAIPVEMFNVPYETITGAPRNILGIREKLLPGQMNRDGVAALHGFEGAPPRPRRSDGARRSPASSASSSSSGAPSGASGTRSGIQEIDACPVLQFDATNLVILGYSPGFAFGRRRPPPIGSSLLDLPACDTNAEFMRSFDASAAALIELSRASPNDVTVEFNSTIVFQSSGERFRVDATIKMVASWEPGANPGDQAQVPRAVGTVKVLSTIRDQARPVSSSASSEGTRLQL